FEIAYNEYNRLKITEAGKRVLFGQDKAQLITLIDKEEVKVKPKTRKVSQVRELSETDTKLFDQLRVLRKELAKKQEVPAYIIFSDKVLHLLASSKPTTLAQFGNISGIGEYKKEQYGELFIKVIQDFMS
ncbi:MAG: HRDC domain-containing protein, partial [Bacteroides sp.]